MPDLDHRPDIDLITVGRVTGRPHIIEIWFARHDQTIYMPSGGGDRSDWVRNLVSTPAVTVRAGAVDYPGSGRIVADPHEARLAREAVYARYAPTYGGDLTGWRDTALPVAVDIHHHASPPPTRSRMEIQR